MKKIEINRYLVPFDFTEATEDAFDYAHMLVERGGGEILLVHFVEKSEDIAEASLKLTHVVSRHIEEYTPCVSFKVLQGDIYEDLDKTAHDFDASAIVMGIHGRTGIRKIFGSNALKVVAESHIPFILTQENQKEKALSTIVMPFNFERKSLQITQFASSIAEKFNATIHLVGYASEDKSLEREMELNAIIVKKHLESSGVAHKITTLEGGHSFQKALLDYAHGVDADLIAAAYFDDSFLSMFNTFVDSLIENEDRIPVITVNGPDVMRHSPKLDYVPV